MPLPVPMLQLMFSCAYNSGSAYVASENQVLIFKSQVQKGYKMQINDDSGF